MGKPTRTKIVSLKRACHGVTLAALSASGTTAYREGLEPLFPGFGRIGSMMGSRHWGVKPDIMNFAKGINSGYVPFGDRISDYFRSKGVLIRNLADTFIISPPLTLQTEQVDVMVDAFEEAIAAID